jgi:hypothetical protein
LSFRNVGSSQFIVEQQDWFAQSIASSLLLKGTTVDRWYFGDLPWPKLHAALHGDQKLLLRKNGRAEAQKGSQSDSKKGNQRRWADGSHRLEVCG